MEGVSLIRRLLVGFNWISMIGVTPQNERHPCSTNNKVAVSHEAGRDAYARRHLPVLSL